MNVLSVFRMSQSGDHPANKFKATSHSTIFDIPMRPVREDQRHQRRFTR